MKIVINTKDIDLNQALRDLVDQKLGSLDKFAQDIFGEDYYDHFFGKGPPTVEMWVELGRTTKHHRKGKIFRAEAQMRFPGQSIRSEAVAENIRLAVTEVKDELQREIKQYQGKARAEMERGARKVKRETRVAEEAKTEERKRVREEGL